AKSLLKQRKMTGVDECQCARSFYGDVTSKDGEAMDEGHDDIEAEIKKEVQGMQGSKQQALFVPVKLDILCGRWSTPFLPYMSFAINFPFSIVLQDTEARGASLVCAEDLRRGYGLDDASENQIREATYPYDTHGQGFRKEFG
ncbi:MAG: hypothetical protein Q9183_007088, partial [Haloplaca sp. 2 TL-2023]